MKNFIIVGVLLLAYLLVANSVFIVRETERAIMLRFGEIVEADIPPGLHFKMPWVNTVRKFDARIMTVDSTPQRFLTIEQKALLVDSYGLWRIVDVERFYTATSGEESRASNLLAQRINDGLRNEFGERDLQEVVSGQRDLLMGQLTQELNETTAREYGIEVIDVRLKRIDLPDDVRSSVYERMTSERQREAQQLRSRGNELAIGIEADADRQEAVLLVEAYRDAERIRGEGDAQAAATYASAYNQDPEFYSFTRRLNSYRDTFDSQSDVLLLDPNSDYFRYLHGENPQLAPAPAQ